jgi:GntR family transcriptional regulator
MPDPRWRQIAEDLRQKIEAGQLGSEGKPLPSELELSDEYKASRNTIRDAVKWLVTRGLLVTRPGQGTFVVQKIDPLITALSTEIGAGLGGESAAYASEVQKLSRKPTVSDPKIEIHQAAGMIAAELRLPQGATVVSRHQERRIDRIPWSLQTSFYPMTFFTDGATRIIEAVDIEEGVVPYMEKVIGFQQAGWRERFTVRAPDRKETEFFSLPDDGRIAVIETIRTGYDQTGKPFRVTVTTYPADRNQFVLSVGDVPGLPPENAERRLER